MVEKITLILKFRVVQYFFGDVVFKASKFVFIAALTYLIDKSSIGFYTLFESTVVLSKSFFSLGLANYVQTKNHQLRQDDFKQLINLVTSFKLITGILFGLLAVIFVLTFNLSFFSIPPLTLSFAIFSGLSISMFQVFLETDIVKGNSKYYVTQKNLFNLVLIISLLISAIIYSEIQVLITVYTTCHVGLLLYVLLKRNSTKFNTVLRGALKTITLFKDHKFVYFLPYNILLWGISFSDRFIIEQKLDLENVALYSTAFSFASVISVLAISLKNSVIPKIYSSLNIENDKSYLTSKVFIHTFGCVMIIFSSDLYTLLLPENYFLGYKTFMVIALSFIVFLDVTIREVKLFHKNLVNNIVLTQFILLAFNISGNLIFVNKHGIVAVSFVTLLTILLQLTIYILLTREYLIKQLKREITSLSILFASFGVCFFIELDTVTKISICFLSVYLLIITTSKKMKIIPKIIK